VLTKKFLMFAKYKKIQENAETVNVRRGKFETLINSQLSAINMGGDLSYAGCLCPRSASFRLAVRFLKRRRHGVTLTFLKMAWPETK
jgi:hypothetical protein